jgi:hypothetical protein
VISTWAMKHRRKEVPQIVKPDLQQAGIADSAEDKFVEVVRVAQDIDPTRPTGN